MSKLIIDLNDEYKVKLENENEFDTSIFRDVYRNAAKNVAEIIKQSSSEFKYEYNNIIAFTGERGKGKSSSMISFLNSLIEIDNKIQINDSFYANDNFNIIKKKSFGTIDIIDPSLFRGKESLFEIIIAKMFSRFEQAINEPSCKLSDDNRRNILSNFQNVFENLKIIKGDRGKLFEQETIEALSNLATSSNLKRGFHDLVEAYLDNFIHKDYLVIAIDDFDLNISGVYDMLEDIRQFLIQRKIILLISCKLEQLKDALVNHYDINFKNIASNNSDKANRYLDKLIPFSKRCDLPELIDLRNKTFEIIDRNNEKIFDNQEEDIETVILELLFNNHNLLISKSKYRFNSIIPKTLRELQELFNIIVEKDQLENLKKYLLSIVRKENVYPEIFEDIDRRNGYNLNLYIILKLRSILKIGREGIRESIRENFAISSLVIDTTIFRELVESTNPDNVSIGDVYAYIKNFEALVATDDPKNNQFIDFIKLYFTIRNLERAKHSNETLIGGIYNGSLRLFRFDGRKRRDWVEFNYPLKDINDELKSLEEKFTLSLFIHITGKNYKYYRRDSSSPFFKSDFQFENGIFSPIAFLTNSVFGEKNLNTLNQEAYEEVELLSEISKWSENNILIDQLNNVMFLDEFLSRINNYIVGYKSGLPNNYFETISFYIVNAGINALKEIIESYNFLDNTILTLYTNHPLVQAFAKYNHDKKIFVIEDNLFDYGTINQYFTEDLIKLINEIYQSPNVERGENILKNTPITEKLKVLQTRIRNNPNYTIKTLSMIINEIIDIDQSSPIVDMLSEYKPDIISGDPERIRQGKAGLKKFLESTLNGQS